MQFFTGKNSWPPDRSSASEKRKHESVDSPLHKEGRKRPRAESAASNRDDRNRQQSEERLHSPSSSNTQRSPIIHNSLPSPPIQPDRLQMVTPGSASHYNTSKKYPPSPLSRSPEHSLETFAADEPNPSKTYYSNPVWKADSRRLSNKTCHPQPLQIDTARALNGLNPRSPGYAARGMPSEFKVNGASHQQHSRDADQPPLDTPSRRQSATMPPPTSASNRPPRSESSTPKMNTPISVSEPMNPASAAFNSFGHNKSTSKAFSLTSNGEEVALPKVTASPSQITLAPEFISFGQSIMAMTNVGVKLENMNQLALENVKESRRHEKHSVAYASLVDHISSHHGAIQKAKTKLEKQFERYNKNQDQIANRLQAHVAHLPAIRSNDAAIRTDGEVHKELLALQEELREIKNDLANQRNRCVSQEGLDKELAHKVSLGDLEQLAPREELFSVTAKLSSHASDLKSLEMKLSELATVGNKRHDEAQETQKQHDNRIGHLDSAMSTAARTSQQIHANTQIKLAELESDIGSLRQDSSMQTKLADIREKNVDAWKEECALIKKGFEQIKSGQTSLEAFVRGDSVNSELCLSSVIEKASKEISQMKILVEQLKEKITKLEEGWSEDLTSLHRQSTPIDHINNLNGRVDGIRQDVTEVRGDIVDLKGEFEFLAGDIDNIRKGFTHLKEEHGRSKEGMEKQQSVHSQSVQPQPESSTAAYTNGLVSTKNPDRIKLEQLENDIQCLDAVMKSQQQRFDTLTTEDMAQSIIHQTKLLYKEHPGHVQDKLKGLEEQQRKVDAYITSYLQPKLLHVDTQLNLRAGGDALHPLHTRVQALEANLREANSQIRKILSEGTSSAPTPGEQGPHDTRIDELLSPLRVELKDVRSKHAELVEMVMSRHGKLRGDVQILNLETYTGAAGNPLKQAQLRELLEYLDLTKLDTEDEQRTESVRSVGLSEEIISRASIASMSPSRQESIASGPDGRRSASSDQSDTSMHQVQARKRKRRRSLPSIVDDEDEDDGVACGRATGKDPR